MEALRSSRASVTTDLLGDWNVRKDANIEAYFGQNKRYKQCVILTNKEMLNHSFLFHICTGGFHTFLRRVMGVGIHFLSFIS